MYQITVYLLSHDQSILFFYFRKTCILIGPFIKGTDAITRALSVIGYTDIAVERIREFSQKSLSVLETMLVGQGKVNEFKTICIFLQ